MSGSAGDVIPKLVSIDDTRSVFGGISRSTVNEWIKTGKLRTVKVCGRRLVYAESIRELIDTSAA